MAELQREEFFNRVNDFIGDTQDDNAISFMEDMIDTFNGLERRANEGGEDLERRLRENDAAWRKKYTARFMSTGGGNYTPDEDDPPKTKESKDITFDDIFRKKEC